MIKTILFGAVLIAMLFIGLSMGNQLLAARPRPTTTPNP